MELFDTQAFAQIPGQIALETDAVGRIAALRANADRYLREAAISGPNDRRELERKAREERRCANQLEWEAIYR
jgi:hypothetical protein